jgi:pimeloyl-ACP methyl ester carboxylesterase
MMPQASFAHHTADLGDVRLHYVTCGSGPPVVLLHGWPQTWWEWRHIMPPLAEHYTVIAPDMRGLGDSSCPPNGYDKKTVALDIWRLVHEMLGGERFFLVGHDWGAPVAYFLAHAHPEAVKGLTILDMIIPFGTTDALTWGGKRWHHSFHWVRDLPEALVVGRERLYLSWFYTNLAYNPAAITPLDRSLSDREFNFVKAPLTLNDPVFCKHSILRNISVPTILEKVSDLCNGVFLILMSSELLALDISSIVGFLRVGIVSPFIQNISIDASSPLLIILCSQVSLKPIST